MSKSLMFRCILVASLLLVQVALAGDDPVFDVPKLDGITIDGKVEDWEDRGLRLEMLDHGQNYAGRSDFYPDLRLGWDEEGLLVLAIVQDDVVSPRVLPFVGDSAAVTVATEPGSDEYYTVAIEAVTESGGTQIGGLQDHRASRDEMGELAADFGGGQTPDGYLIEGRLPWQNLAIAPLPGRKLGFIIWFNDVDEVGSKAKFDWPRGAGRDSSVMNRLRLSESPITVAAVGGYEDFRVARVAVYAPRSLAGKEITLKEGGATVAVETLAEQDSRATAELRTLVPPGKKAAPLHAVVQGCPPAQVHMPDLERERARWLIEANLIFQPYCFHGEALPKVDFEQPLLAEQVIGPYSIETTYYDADFREVAQALEAGRYGAVVQIAPEAGDRPIRRFRTLYRMPERIEWWTIKSPMSFAWSDEVNEKLGLAPAVVAAQSNAIGDFVKWQIVDGFSRDHAAAELFAGLSEIGPSTQPMSPADLEALSRQWWVECKRKFYGTDRIYPEPFVCPRPVEGKSAPVVRDGTLEEAGMKPDAAKEIDAVLNDWSKHSDHAFAVCVVRHGVIVLHKAYGIREGEPMTVDTKSWMASITKLMSGTLMMMLVDQGLVDLDGRVDKYLPAFRGIGVETPLTVRHLYTHTNGLWDHWGDDMHDLDEVIADYYPFLEVGVRYRYNGVGFALGGKIIEAVTGEAIPQFYANHLLRPLGCQGTEVYGTSGDANSVPLDMAKIGQMLLNRGAYGNMRFFSEETFAKMLPEKLTKVLGPNTSQEYGIGTSWTMDERFGEGTFGHGAASRATLAIDPANDLVIVMTRNAAGEAYGEYNEPFLQAVIDNIAD